MRVHDHVDVHVGADGGDYVHVGVGARVDVYVGFNVDAYV